MSAAKLDTNGKTTWVGGLAAGHHAIGIFKSQSGIDLTEKVKELVRLAQEQGRIAGQTGELARKIRENE